MYFMLIDEVVKIWNNDEIIKPCNTINSFKITGISINLNGSEQHLVKKNDEICEEIILLNDVILSLDDKNTNAEDVLNNNNFAKKKEKNELDNKITDCYNITKKDNMMDIDE